MAKRSHIVINARSYRGNGSGWQRYEKHACVALETLNRHTAWLRAKA
ncbi:hypothetical protein [Streptosporangium amethystogenes]|nr:hypothetical protein [Streptosporangium amethystogenes]